jgi:hypothetical protein
MFNILVPFHRTFWWVRPLSSSRERFYGIHLRSEGRALQGSHLSENKNTDKMKKTDKVEKNLANKEH